MEEARGDAGLTSDEDWIRQGYDAIAAGDLEAFAETLHSDVVWEQISVVARRKRARGELHAKHSTTSAEIVTPYEQHVEIRDGLTEKVQMLTVGVS